MGYTYAEQDSHILIENSAVQTDAYCEVALMDSGARLSSAP